MSAAARPAGILSVLLIVLLGVAWEGFLAPLRPGGSWLVLKTLPLALLLPGMLRGRLRTWQVGSLLILAYLTEGLVRATSDATALSRALGWAEAVLAAVAFAAILAHVRARRLAGQP